jgi:hypothetical protein
MWQENLRYFFGDQLAGKREHKDWEWITINYIWPSAQQEIAKLTKNHPKIIANPWDTNDADAAEAWKSHLQWQWEKGLNGRGMRLEQAKGILDAKLFGYRVSKVFWEPQCEWDDQQKRYMGDVRYKLWHPAEFWADGGEYIDDGNCGTVRYVPLEWAKARWPQHAKALEEDAPRFTQQEAQTWVGDHVRGNETNPAGYTKPSGSGGTDAGYLSGKNNRLLGLVNKEDKMSREPHKNDEVLIKISEIYFKDHEHVSQKEERDIPPERLMAQGAIYDGGDGFLYDAKTNKPFPDKPENWPKEVVRQWREPKYPNGRFVIRSGPVILNPKQQKWAYKKWPFHTVPHYLLPHMWQGSDGIQLYKTAQDMVNITVSHLTNNMKCYGDPKVAIETGALETNPRTKKAYKIGKGAGAVIRLAKGVLKRRGFEILPPAPISGQALSLYQLFAQEYKNIQGMQDIARGQKTTGEMSATESQWLALASNDRIALQSVFEDIWIVGICERVGQLCQDYYEPDRWVRIVGEDKVMGVQQITQKMKTIRFDVDILPATTLPYDEEKRAEKHLKAYEILSMPVVNPMLPEVLRDLEVTNWKKLIEQHEPWMLWMQFLQLYEAVKEGQITPEQGVQMIIQAAMQKFDEGQQSIEGVAAANAEKEKLDRERESIKAEGQKEGQQKERDRQQAKDEAKREAEAKSKAKEKK